MKSNSKKRVAVTGVGAVSALGHNFADTWEAIKKGETGVKNIKRFATGEMPTQIAYEVRDYKADTSDLSEQDLKTLSYIGEFAYGAAQEALKQAGLWQDESYRSSEKSVILGVRPASPTFKWYHDIFLNEAYDKEDMRYYSLYNPMQMLSFLSRSFKATGGNIAVQTACASSGQSIGEAYEQIASGRKKVVLSGGVDSMIEPFSVAGFNLLGALSTSNEEMSSASRPFDIDRNGFVLGEGAGILVLEELDSAKARGAEILGEVVGYGVTESAYRITDLNPEGVGPIEAMQLACKDANIKPSAVGYINAHGTSTHLNDKVESLSVNRVFGKNVKVSSTKSMTGHMIAAAGGIEFLFCIAALREQTLPPSLNIFRQDPQCEVTLTKDKAESCDIEYALSNSVGFGGSNTSLIARRVK